uniref:Uncharacterized protein n=2 Tax=Parascaris univalens TaxID=6257 RepID=A0A914ZR42_PARUN
GASYSDRSFCYGLMRIMLLKEVDEDYDVLYPALPYVDLHSPHVPTRGNSVEVKHPKGSGLATRDMNGAAFHHDIYKFSNDDRASVHFGMYTSNKRAIGTIAKLNRAIVGVYRGVHNSTAINVVFGLMMSSVLIVLFLAFLVFITRLRSSQQEEDNLTGAIIASRRLYGNMHKGKSPYVITPTKKAARHLLAFEKMQKEIECESTAIATVLLFLAKNIEPPSGVMFYPVHPSALLVPRPRTKFDDPFLSHYQLQSELQKMMAPINFTETTESDNNADSSKRDFFDAKRREILAEEERNQRNFARSSSIGKNLYHLDLKTASKTKHS